MSLAHLLSDGALEHPERPAPFFAGQAISYRELERHLHAAAGSGTTACPPEPLARCETMDR